MCAAEWQALGPSRFRYILKTRCGPCISHVDGNLFCDFDIDAMRPMRRECGHRHPPGEVKGLLFAAHRPRTVSRTEAVAA
jgi:hypothetical protein